MNRPDYEKIGKIIYANERLQSNLGQLVGAMSGAGVAPGQPMPMLLARARYEGEKYFSAWSGGAIVKDQLFDALEMLRELDACCSGLEIRSLTDIDRLLVLRTTAQQALEQVAGALGERRTLSA